MFRTPITRLSQPTLRAATRQTTGATFRRSFHPSSISKSAHAQPSAAQGVKESVTEGAKNAHEAVKTIIDSTPATEEIFFKKSQIPVEVYPLAVVVLFGTTFGLWTASKAMFSPELRLKRQGPAERAHW